MSLVRVQAGEPVISFDRLNLLQHCVLEVNLVIKIQGGEMLIDKRN